MGGDKRERPHAQDWYKTHEAAHLARIEAEWQAQPLQTTPPQPEEDAS